MSHVPVVHAARTRPSRLAEHTGAIREVLGGELPADFARFYAETDGLEVDVTVDDQRSMASAEIVSLDAAFDDFKAHRQSDDVEGYDPSYEEPHCETVWSPDAEVDDDEALARMNRLRRAKLVMSLEGLPEWIVVDFAPEDGGFEGRGYQLVWVYEGSEAYPLALDFPKLVGLVKKLGAPFYHAYLPAHMFDLDAVRGILAPYTTLHPDVVEELLTIASSRDA